MRSVPFVITGLVLSIESLAGSFYTARIKHDNGDMSIHTIGLGEDFRFPKEGDKIQLFGIIRNGQRLTGKWKFANPGEQRPGRVYT